MEILLLNVTFLTANYGGTMIVHFSLDHQGDRISSEIVSQLRQEFGSRVTI